MCINSFDQNISFVITILWICTVQFFSYSPQLTIFMSPVTDPSRLPKDRLILSISLNIKYKCCFICNNQIRPIWNWKNECVAIELKYPYLHEGSSCSLPNTTWWLSSMLRFVDNVMKNCDPFVSLPSFAIETNPE